MLFLSVSYQRRDFLNQINFYIFVSRRYPEVGGDLCSFKGWTEGMYMSAAHATVGKHRVVAVTWRRRFY